MAKEIASAGAGADYPDPVNVICSFVQEIIDKLNHGTLNVRRGFDATPMNKETSFSVSHKGRTVELGELAQMIMIDDVLLEKDSWVPKLYQRLWNACQERWVFQGVEETDRARGQEAQCGVIARQSRYRALAERLKK